MKRKVTISLAVLLIGLFLFVKLSSFRLEKKYERSAAQCVLTQELRSRIRRETKGADVSVIVDYSLELTAERLFFSEKNNISDGKANCIGYARFCSDVCNYAFKYNGLSYVSKPVVGIVYYFNIDLCKMLTAVVPERYKGFVKDHDFIEITSGSSTVFYFDPCLYDVIGNRCETPVK